MCILPFDQPRVCPAHLLDPLARRHLALDALGGRPISQLASESLVSRKFVYQQLHKAQAGLDLAFDPPDQADDLQLLFLAQATGPEVPGAVAVLPQPPCLPAERTSRARRQEPARSAEWSGARSLVGTAGLPAFPAGRLKRAVRLGREPAALAPAPLCAHFPPRYPTVTLKRLLLNQAFTMFVHISSASQQQSVHTPMPDSLPVFPL
jgi:hypothetical protein